jgi:hypothetical protein
MLLLESLFIIKINIDYKTVLPTKKTLLPKKKALKQKKLLLGTYKLKKISTPKLLYKELKLKALIKPTILLIKPTLKLIRKAVSKIKQAMLNSFLKAKQLTSLLLGR